MEIRGGAALVTGGLGGLGRAIGARLRDEGCSLAVAGGVGDGVEELADEVGGVAVVADLATRDGVSRVVDAVGGVDLLVAGVGGSGVGAFGGFGLDDIDRVIDVGLRGPLVLTRLFGESMVARGRGHVVFVSSLAGKAAGPDAALHSAVAFGVRGFALGLRQDWAPLGVGVSCVNVGAVGEAETADGVALPAGFRPKSPEDVAAAVVRAVRHDRAEMDVADPVMRAGVVFGQLAPQAAARLSRFAGSDQAGGL
ncbi:SDR family NAD(P)-dependent oxidoreductase [Actinophytocola sp. NPDC049390]|uniref:SDR family NAD(P)-dependent oxidoreductase n=1 Tax=Actinophytocola sp. NPDC049390 TaxID=3363894 RepID=UPI0037BAC6CB